MSLLNPGLQWEASFFDEPVSCILIFKTLSNNEKILIEIFFYANLNLEEFRFQISN